MKKNNILEDGVKPRVRRVKLRGDNRENFFIQSLSSALFRTAKTRSRLRWSDLLNSPKKRGIGVVVDQKDVVLSGMQELERARAGESALSRLKRARDAKRLRIINGNATMTHSDN